MNERPILFSTPMVEGILARRKKLTRRIVKINNPDEIISFTRTIDLDYNEWYVEWDSGDYTTIKCPYGKPGDILWVRETWCEPVLFDGAESDYYYKADDNLDRHINGKWRPSIFMPKVACRIRLQITHIRVERLHDISPGDACEEGIEYYNIDAEALEGGELQADFVNYMWKDDEKYEDYYFPTYANAIESFKSLWEKINGKETWEANPWVWVISFKRI